MIAVFMYLIISTKRIYENASYYTTLLIQLTLGLTLYDIIFYIFHTASTQLHGFLIGFLVILNLFGFGIKLLLIIACIVLKVKVNNSNNK